VIYREVAPNPEKLEAVIKTLALVNTHLGIECPFPRIVWMVEDANGPYATGPDKIWGFSSGTEIGILDSLQGRDLLRVLLHEYAHHLRFHRRPDLHFYSADAMPIVRKVEEELAENFSINVSRWMLGEKK